MPEGLFPEPALINAIKTDVLQKDGVEPDNIEKAIVPQYPETEYIDMGSENIVIVHPDNTEKIVKYRYKEKSPPSPIEKVALYHMHRVMSTLFPQHFPHIFSAKEGPNASVVMERIYAHLEASTSLEAAVGMAQYIESNAAMMAGVHVKLDPARGNFIPDKDSNIKYIDFVLSDVSTFDVDKQKAIRYFEMMNGWKDKKIVDAQKKQLEQSIQRLEELRVIYYAYHKGCELMSPEVLEGLQKLNDEGKRRVERTVQLLKPIYQNQFPPKT